MLENENVGMEQVENTEANVETTATDVVSDDTTKNDETSQVGGENEKPQETITKARMNEIIRERIERERNSIIKKYGGDEKSDLDSIFSKALSYETMKEEYDSIIRAKLELETKLAFIENNVEPTKQDDVMAHFKGKGIEFNNETLKQELSTHPEWLKAKETSDKPITTIKEISPSRNEVQPQKNEEDEVASLFGLPFIVK